MKIIIDNDSGVLSCKVSGDEWNKRRYPTLLYRCDKQTKVKVRTLLVETLKALI